MLFTILKLGPVLWVGAKIDFVDGPEASHLVLVHLPHVVVLDGKDDESVGVVLEKWLWENFLGGADLALSAGLRCRQLFVFLWVDLGVGSSVHFVVLVEDLRAMLGGALFLRELLSHGEVFFLALGKEISEFFLCVVSSHGHLWFCKRFSW